MITPKKPGPGRPTKYNQKITEEICGYIADDALYEQDAALCSGISVTTMTEWKTRYPEFKAAVQKANALKVKNLSAHITKAAPENWTAAMALLERIRPERYGRQSRTPVEPEKEKAAAPSTGGVLSKLTDALRRRGGNSVPKDEGEES